MKKPQRYLATLARPEQTLLYQLVEAHYPAFVEHLAACERTLPAHVVREFENYLKCGRRTRKDNRPFSRNRASRVVNSDDVSRTGCAARWPSAPNVAGQHRQQRSQVVFLSEISADWTAGTSDSVPKPGKASRPCGRKDLPCLVPSGPATRLAAVRGRSESRTAKKAAHELSI